MRRQAGRIADVAGFFTDVAGPNRVRRTGLRRSAERSRSTSLTGSVLGRRMEDQLRIAVCLWHSFNWPGSDVFGVGTFDRPWLAPGATRWRRRAPSSTPRSSSSTSSACPFFTFHDRDVAPEGGTFAETIGACSTRSSRRSRATWSGPESGCCGARRTSSATRATRPGRRPTPTPRSSPTRPRR